MYVTNGLITFDYHGYVLGEKLLSRYWKGHQDCYCGWQANIEKIDFPLLDTTALNKRKHLGPDQSFGDPAPRARDFIKSKKLPAQGRNSI